jgi:hypothetical protein
MIPILRTVLACCVVALSGCAASWKHVMAGPAKLPGGLTLQPENDWSAWKYGAVQTWTVHGPSLEAVTIVSGLKDGKSIARPASYKDKMPLFRSGMAASEIAELTVETLLRTGYGKVEIVGVQPDTFAGTPGFRFGMTLVDSNGLEKLGFGTGAVVDGKLYMILYCAPNLHYFDKYKPAVEQLIASARID